MKHVADGTLRRMLDEPLSVRDADRHHVRDCDACRRQFALIAADAQATERLLTVPSTPVDVTAAFARLRERAVSEGHPEAARPAGGLRSWYRQRRPWSIWNHQRQDTRRLGTLVPIAALALIGAVAWTPAGSLAQQFITVFQPSHVAAVPVTFTDLKSLAELRKYGTFNLPRQLPTTSVPDAAVASASTGMHVLTPPSLPSGVPADGPNGGNAPVRYEVLPGDTASFTFSAAKAEATARAEGKSIPPMPPNIDGSTLTVTMRAGVVAAWGTGQGNVPALIIGQMRAPIVEAASSAGDGVTVKELEDYILGMPGISAQLAAEIRSIGDPTKTLPIPVVINREQAQQVQVQGVQGLAVGDQTGVGSGVIWEKNGVIYGVEGPMTLDQVVAVANGLR